MTPSEAYINSLKLVRDEMGNTAEALELQLELGIATYGPDVTRDAIDNFFRLQALLMTGYIQAAEDALRDGPP